MRPYLTRPATHGLHENLMREVAVEPLLHKNFTRLDVDLFNQIVERVGPHNEKSKIFCREPLGTRDSVV